MDRIADLVQQLEPETSLPIEGVQARQRDALLRSMAPLDGARRYSRGRRPRRKGWFVAVTGVAAVAVVTAILVPRSSPSVRSRTPTPAVLTAITSALANTRNDVEKVQSTVPGTPLSTTSWVDPGTGSCRVDTSLNGQPSFTVFVGHGNAEFIDYRLREWWTRKSGGVVCEPLTPRAIEDDLAAGDYTVVGHSTVDEQPSLKLVSTVTTTGSHPMTKFKILWVNATTFLPIQSTSSGHLTEQTFFTWLPTSSTNTAILKVAVPPGFRQMATPPPTATSGRESPS